MAPGLYHALQAVGKRELPPDEQEEINAYFKPTKTFLILWNRVEMWCFDETDEPWEDILGVLIEAVGIGDITGAEFRRVVPRLVVGMERKGIFLPEKFADIGYWKWHFQKHGMPWKEHMERVVAAVGHKSFAPGSNHDFHPVHHGKPSMVVRTDIVKRGEPAV